MKNDLFDDLLRQKLDHHSEPISELEVERTHKHVQKQLSTSIFAQSISIWNSILVVLTASALLFGYHEYRTSQLEKTKVEWLQNELALKQKNLVQIEQSNQLLSQKMATIQKSVESLHQQIKLQSEVIARNLNAVSFNENSMAPNRPVAFKSKTPSNLIAENIPQKTKESVSQHSSDIKISSSFEASKSETTQPKENNAIAKHISETLKDSIAPIQLATNDIKNKSISVDTTSNFNDSDLIPIKSNFLKKIDFRVGIIGNLSTNLAGAGICGEVILKDKWALSVGIQQGIIKGENYYDESEYLLRTNSDFRSDYARGFTSIANIRNINFSYAVTQIPISLQFRKDWKKKLTFIGSTGTDLTLATKQMVQYSVEGTSFMMDKQHTERPLSLALFSSANIGLGVEKRWGPWQLQVVPTLNYSFKKSSISDDVLSGFVRAKLLYTF